MHRGRHEPGKALASSAFSLAAGIVVGPRLHDINSGLRVFRRAVLPSLDLRPGMHRFLPAQAHRAGFRVVEVAVRHRPRKHGRSKHSYARAFVGLWGLMAMRRPRLRAVAIALVALAATGVYAARLDQTYPIGDWLVWKYATIWAWTLFLGVACASAGHLALSRALGIVGLPTLETVVDSIALGVVIFVLGMYAGGLAHQFNARFAVAWPLVMLLAGARPLAAFVRARLAAGSRGASSGGLAARALQATIVAFGLVGVGFVYLGVMAPDAINFDASWSHLKIAVDYARHGGIVPFDADYTRNVPELTSLVHTFAMIVPAGPLREPQLRWMLAQHLEFFFFLVTLGGVAAMARWLVDEVAIRGAWAAFFLFPGIFVYDSNLGCAADHYVALFAAPLFLAAVRAMARFEARACILAGALAAGALLTKYQAVYLLAGVGAVVAAQWLVAVKDCFASKHATPTAARTLLVGPAAFVATVVALTSVHFAKNWVFHHNPIYPFAQERFASHPTVPHAAYLFHWLGLDDRRFSPHGPLLSRVLESLRLTFTFSFEPHYSFTKNVPVVGSLFTLCLALVFWLRPARRLWLGYAAGLGALFAWAMIYRVDRHLQIFLPLLVAVTAAVLFRAWQEGGIARIGVGALVGLQVIWGGDALVYDADVRIAAAFALVGSGYEGQASSRFHHLASEIELGRTLPPDARVLLHEHRPSLGIDRDVLLDIPGAQGLVSYEGVRGPRSLWQLWRGLGVTHVVWLPGDGPAANKQEDVLVTDFVSRFGQNRRRFAAEELVTLPDAPPPVDGPYRVLSLGGAHDADGDGYADGLYPVEAMQTYEAIQAPRERYPSPERPWSTNPALQSALLTAADAVVLFERHPADAALRARLAEEFIVGQRYANRFAIYVRKPLAPSASTSSTP